MNEPHPVAPGRGIEATLIVVSEWRLARALGQCAHVDCGLPADYRVVVVASGVTLTTWLCAGHYREVFSGGSD